MLLLGYILVQMEMLFDRSQMNLLRMSSATLDTIKHPSQYTIQTGEIVYCSD
jgi:hypothetical protein